MITNANELAERWARPAKMLVIDDDVPLCEIITRGFAHLDCEVDCVNTGAAALDYLKAQPQPDAVLLDIRLPDMPGESVLVAMRKLNLHTPVIVITGYPSESVTSLIQSYGVIAVLNKPVTHFVRTVARYLTILNIRHTGGPLPPSTAHSESDPPSVYTD